MMNGAASGNTAMKETEANTVIPMAPATTVISVLYLVCSG